MIKRSLLSCLILAALVGGPPASRAEDSSRRTQIQILAEDLKTGLEYKRLLAVETLGRMKTEEATGLLIDAMIRDRYLAVRRAAQAQLVNVADPRIFPAVEAALGDPDRKVRLGGLEAMGTARDPVAAQRILECLQANPRDTDLVLQGLESLRIFTYHTEPAPGYESALLPYLQHPDERVRMTALGILGILGRPDTLDAFLGLWPKATDQEKVRLADAFANIGWEKPSAVLTAALESRNRDVVIHGLYALSQIQSFSSLGKIRDLLQRRPDALTAVAGLNALIEIPDPDNVPAVLGLLDHADPSVRHWAAYALGQLRATGTVPKLLDMLKDKSSLVRASALTTLAELHAGQAYPQVQDLAFDPREPTDVRQAAVRALMQLSGKPDSERMWREIVKPSADLALRLTFAMALGETGDKTWADRLAAHLEDRDFGVSFSAALGLGTLGDRRGMDLLIKSLDHGSPVLRQYAILGLAKLREPEVNTALAATAGDDQDPVVRILCAANLVAAGLTDFRVLLWNGLDTKDEDVRSEAVTALGRTADADTLRQLKWYLRREPSVPVRETILRVLRDAEGPALPQPKK